MVYSEIQPTEMTEDQKRMVFVAVRRAANLLKKWAEFYPSKKFRKFRNLVMSGDKNPQTFIIENEGKKDEVKKITGKIPADRLVEFHNDLPFILQIREPNEELGGQTIEDAVLKHYSALAKQHVRQWAMDGEPHGASRLDYTQEAYMTIIEAMYQFTRDDIEFSTFAWWALRNRMINVTNQGNLFCPLTNSDLKLVIRYDQAKKKGGGTFDQIVEDLGLTPKEGVHLGAILSKVFPEAHFGQNEGTTDQLSNDYTELRSGVDRELNGVDLVEQQESVNSILVQADLNPLERQILDIAMNPYYGWQADLAKTHNCSRAWIGQNLTKARAKVAAVMKESEAA